MRKILLDPSFYVPKINSVPVKDINYFYILYYIIPLFLFILFVFILKYKFKQKILYNSNIYTDDE